MKLFRIPLLALGLLAACGDGSTGTEGGRLGSLRFDYSGSGYGGSFSASGALETDGSGRPEFRSFAFATRDESLNDVVLVTAFDAGQHPRGDAMLLAVESAVGTGDYSLDFDCDPDFEGDCAFGIFMRDVDLLRADVEMEPQGEALFFESGTVRLTRLTGTVVEGSFSGTGVFVDLETGEESGPVQVTGGTFRVPVLSADEAGVLASRGAPAPALLRRPARPAR
jgi:hypothetical protein